VFKPHTLVLFGRRSYTDDSPYADSSHLGVAITPFKVIQGHRFWYQSKARMRRPISD